MTKADFISSGSSGLFGHALAWLSALLKYLRSRALLAAIEAKEAGLQFGIAAAMVFSASLLILLGYVFAVVAAVFGIAAACGGGNAWIGVIAAAALLHFAGAALLVVLARRRVRNGAFTTTLDELKKDQTWLENLAKNR